MILRLLPIGYFIAEKVRTDLKAIQFDRKLGITRHFVFNEGEETFVGIKLKDSFSIRSKDVAQALSEARVITNNWAKVQDVTDEFSDRQFDLVFLVGTRP